MTDKKNIPAINIALENIHLIEASAGTGKTWTLTALVIRLLLEKKRPCDQIIATTFTRAAAAEIRQNIRERIQETKKLIESILLAVPDVSEFVVGDDVDTTFQYVHNALQSHNKPQAQLLDGDLAHQQIIKHLLKEMPIPSEEANKEELQAKQGLFWAKNSLDLTLIQLDRMFIGTLDSLCQKLLREFAFDLLLQQGQGQQLSLTEGDSNVTVNLIHDAIRIWRTEQHSHNSQLMALLTETNQLKDVADLKNQVNQSLNFISSPLLDMKTVSVDLETIDRLVTQLEQSDDSILKEFLDESGEYHQDLWGNRALKNNGASWHSLKRKLIKHTSTFPSYANKDSSEHKLLEGIAYKIDTNFSKKGAAAKAIFVELPVVKLLYTIAEELKKISTKLTELVEHRNYFVCRYVRTQLPIALEKQGKTTFSLQLRHLNKALQKDTDKTLATQIRHRYPFALIDECQDVNADQAGMLQYIYQHDQLKEKDFKNSCLLLVGDPKQAIYGFRGGDINNYQGIKHGVDASRIHTLDTNRRSQNDLISSLNTLFGAKKDFLEDVEYQCVQAKVLDEVVLDAQHKPVTGLLRHIAVSEHKKIHTISQDTHKEAEASIGEVLAQKIAHLLATHYVQDKDAPKRKIRLDEIAILYRSKFDVVGVERHLHKRGIAAFKVSTTSVFADEIATDMASIMQAMLQPQQLNTVRRALVSKAFGFNQKELEALQENQSFVPQQWRHTEKEINFATLQVAFSDAGKAWQTFGFLAGWQLLAEQFDIWQRLAHYKTGERLLVDTRHLLEIIQIQALESSATMQNKLANQKDDNQLQEKGLYKWFLQQLTAKPTSEWSAQRRLPSANGVQMMTIHKSKGLGFPVVFVVGIDGKSRSAKPLESMYTIIETASARKQLVITAQAGKNNENITAVDARQYAEDIRVAYVALTRAKQLLYVVTKNSLEETVIKKNTKGQQTGVHKNALAHWLVHDDVWQADIATAFTTDTVDLESNFELANNTDETPEQQQLCPPAKPRKTHFKTWRNTSFSALARDLHNDNKHSDITTQTESQAEQSPDYVMESLLEEQQLAAVYEEQESSDESGTDSGVLAEVNPIRFTFPRGANAGSFLHKVFEKLDFMNRSSWQWLIQSCATDFGIEQEFTRYNNEFTEESKASVVTWLQEILQTPLSSGSCLESIPNHKRLPEMGFSLGLGSSFSTTQLSELLQEQGFDIQIPHQKKLFRFLKGEIDLVYEHAGRFYILDYKSNYLGDTLVDYNQKNLQEAMSHAGYWLQASIYMLALHRYLQLRLPEYDPHQHLGGVEYAFIRGMHAHSIENETHATGVISWLPPVEFVEQLDDLFGH